jgi:hypothetical protein
VCLPFVQIQQQSVITAMMALLLLRANLCLHVDCPKAAPMPTYCQFVMTPQRKRCNDHADHPLALLNEGTHLRRFPNIHRCPLWKLLPKMASKAMLKPP